MPSTKLLFLGDFSWDLLIYLARIYQKKGTSVVICDYTNDEQLKSYLPKQVNSNIIDDRGLTFILEASEKLGNYLMDFEIQILRMSEEELSNTDIQKKDFVFIGCNQNYQSLMNHSLIVNKFIQQNSNLDYIEVLCDYLPSRIQKKYFTHLRMKKSQKEPLISYTLELNELILKERLYLQHQSKNKLPKLPKDYLVFYEDILDETEGYKGKKFKKLYKKARRKF